MFTIEDFEFTSVQHFVSNKAGSSRERLATNITYKVICLPLMNYLNVVQEISLVSINFITHLTSKLLPVFFPLFLHLKCVCIFTSIHFVLFERVLLHECLLTKITLKFFAKYVRPLVSF